MVDTSSRVLAKGGQPFRDRGPLERVAHRLGAMVTAPALRRALNAIYTSVLRVKTGGRGLRASLPGGERVRVLPEYRFLTWNDTEYAAFRAAARAGMTALDIGANVGAYALLLGQWVGDRGAVFAFEPSPSPFDGLRRHIHLNDLDRIVTAVASAVGATTGTLPFLVAATPGESRLAAGADAASATTVPVTTVDDFCARHNITPDFIKVDVEGAELDVLRGARRTIARGGARLALFVELHPSQWDERGLGREDVQRELDRMNLDVVSLAPGADPWTLEGLCVRLVPRG